MSLTYKEIPLTRGKVAIVDEADYEWLMQWKWYCNKSGYAVRNKLKDGNGERGTLLMHRIILGVEKGQDIDHADRNKLNNQRSNLRLCTNSQNQMNKGMQRNNTSGYIGVCWDKCRGNGNGKWMVHILINKKSLRVGSGSV